MPAKAHAFSRPTWTTASAVLLAGAVLLAAQAAQARDHHGDGGRHDSGRINHYENRGHGGHHRGYDRDRSRFSLNIISGGYYDRPYRRGYGYYAPYYPAAYYPPAPVVVSQPVYYNTTPVTYTTPAAPAGNGRYCREYTKQVWVGGRMQESYGQACMQPDGAWEVDS